MSSPELPAQAAPSAYQLQCTWAHKNSAQTELVEEVPASTSVDHLNIPSVFARIVRSFDPCIACAVHLVTPRGRLLATARVV